MSVSSRLRDLPAKVRLPLQRLLAVGHVDEQVVESVLDAGELAGDNTRLLAFATAFVYMQSHGIPVRDTIAMAKAHGRRVNLSWSPNRWRQEHDRLSRAETLARLARQSVTYDVSTYAAHLPSSFPGYLIRNSRRLGMEGLRQRHCVASYHDQILSGHCAIATVFLDKKRWTVQLGRTGNANAPLRIVQARGRYNKAPSSEEMARIRNILGIPQVRAQEVYPNECRPRHHAENLRRVLPVLREHGVQNVIVSFDGSGDSGSIDGAIYTPAINSRAIAVEIQKTSSAFVEWQWRHTQTIEQVGLDDAIHEIANDWLDETDVDWYNNDGGFGELIIDVEAGTVSLEVNVRFTERNTEYAVTRNIETGEELAV